SPFLNLTFLNFSLIPSKFKVQNFLEAYCSPDDGTGLYIDNSAIGTTSPGNKTAQPRTSKFRHIDMQINIKTIEIPCDNGTLWCLNSTNNTDWMSGRGDPGDG